jgi:hypothetical protein
LFLKGCRTNSLDCDIDLSLRPFFSILRANWMNFSRHTLCFIPATIINSFHIGWSKGKGGHPLTEFYITFIMQYFQHLPRSAHICHLEFIRDSILKVKSKRLIEKLRALHFIPQTGGTFNKACEFYSPHNTVFKHLCPQSLLPPFPFDQTIWKEFMIIALVDLGKEIHIICKIFPWEQMSH